MTFVATYKVELSNGSMEFHDVEIVASGWNEAVALALGMLRSYWYLDSLTVLNK